MVTKFYDILLLIVDYCTFRNALHIVSHLLSKWYSVLCIPYSVFCGNKSHECNKRQIKDEG